MERERTRNDEAYRDKNGKYLNRNDMVSHDGMKYRFEEIVTPIMLARVFDYDGNEHYLIPGELEKDEYVV